MKLPHIDIPSELRKVLIMCKTCSPECCGLRAFDFSPINVAGVIYHLKFNADQVCQILVEIDEFEQSFKHLTPTQLEYKCFIYLFDCRFTEQVFTALIIELRTSVNASSFILDLSDRLKATSAIDVSEKELKGCLLSHEEDNKLPNKSLHLTPDTLS